MLIIIIFLYKSRFFEGHVHTKESKIVLRDFSVERHRKLGMKNDDKRENARQEKTFLTA